MEQLTNINGIKQNLTSFVNVNGSYQVTNQNSIMINNQSSQSFQNDVTFNLAENSSLDLLFVAANTADKVQSRLNFNLEANAKLNVVIVNLNTQVTNNIIEANLNGEGANADINVISVAKGAADTTFNVICNNNKPHTNGNITQRAVALNGGKNVFEATGFIGKDCAKAVNFQESRVLLLDGAAKGDASPILLINHHDVEAGHAAGVSRVNDDEMYYLMSRGISRAAAEELMTIAFIRPVVDNIEDEDIREDVFEKIRKKASYEQ